MKIQDKREFLDKNIVNINKIIDNIQNVRNLNINDLKSKKTVLIIVDMINGFVKKGNLKSRRIEGIVNNVVKTTNLCKNKGCKLIAFIDSHEKNSIEFDYYPEHCLNGTDESEIIDELKHIYSIGVIKKTSTNGFLEEDFKKWLENNKEIENFIVIGNCTDICIMQLVLSLKAYFVKNNKMVNIIIPIDSVETFNSNDHNGDLMNLFSLSIMKSFGINIVNKII